MEENKVENNALEQSWVIYGLKLSGTEEYRYIGQTTRKVKIRLYQHDKYAWRTDIKRDTPIRAWMRKHQGNISVGVIEEIPEGEVALLNEREIYWISYYRKANEGRMLNVAEGGLGVGRGQKLSASHRAAIVEALAKSEKMKNRKNFHTDESREKMSLAHLGVPLTAETRATMSDGRRKKENHVLWGLKHSPETLEKLRQASLGKVLSEETKAKISAGNKGKNKSSGHTRYHTKRNIIKLNCIYCKKGK